VVGRGYWALARDAWTVEADVLIPQLTTDGSFDLPLQSGWNIIVNPFGSALDWDQVQDDNDVGDPQPLWAFDGSFSQSNTLAPGTTGEAFYYLNSDDLDNLTLTPDAQAAGTAASTHDARTEVLGLAAYVDGTRTGRVDVGIADTPKAVVTPRAPFGGAALHALADDERRLATDVRSDDEGGSYTFNLVLEGATGEDVTLRASELSALEGYAATLHLPNGDAIDLHATPEVALSLEQNTTNLRLELEADASIGGEEQPDELELRGNYPNPFADQTTIEYALPSAGSVQLDVFNVLGQRVASLVDDVQQPGHYEVQWDGRGDAGQPLGSGVYLIRLTFNGETRSDRATFVP